MRKVGLIQSWANWTLRKIYGQYFFLGQIIFLLGQIIFLLGANFNSFGADSNSFGANSNSFGANYISFGANIFGANSNSFGANFNSFGSNYDYFRANYIYFGANFIYFEANINLNSNTPRKLCRSLRWSLFISVEVRQALGNCNYCCPIPEWREPEIDFQKNKFIKKWSNHKIEGNKVGLKYFFISKTVFGFQIRWLFSEIWGTKMLQNFLILGTTDTETWSPVVADVVRTWKMFQNVPEGQRYISGQGRHLGLS